MKSAKVKITEQTTEILKSDLGSREATYNGASIEFKNSKGETVSCPANLIDRLGKFAGAPEDKASLEKYLAVYFRATHEATKGAKAGAECRLAAGESVRNGVRVTSTVKGLDAGKARVASQYATAQKMAKEIHAIRAELEKRANVEKIATDKANEAKAAAEQNAAAMAMLCPVAVAA